MGGQRRGDHLRASSTTRPTASRSCFRAAGLQAGRPRGVLPREPPAVPGGRLGRALRRALLHRHELAAHGRRDRVHRQRLRRAGLHHVAPTRPTSPPSWSTPCPTVEVAADDRLATSTASSPTRTRSPRYPAEPLPDAVAGRDMLYSSGTTGRPKGVKPRCRVEPVDTPTAVTGLGLLLFGFTDDDGLPLDRAALPRRTAALHACRCTRSGGTAIVMEHFDPEEALGAHRAVPRDRQPVGADHVHPHAEAARRGAGALRRLEPRRSPSTPPRRARWRSRSR